MTVNNHLKHAFIAIAVAAGGGYSLASSEPPVMVKEQREPAKSERHSFSIALDGDDATIIDVEKAEVEAPKKEERVVEIPAESSVPVMDERFRPRKKVSIPAPKTNEGVSVEKIGQNVSQDAAEGLVDPRVEFKAFVVKSGDTLSGLFKKAGLNDRIMYDVIHGKGESASIQKLYPGETITFGVGDEDQLDSVSLKRNPTKRLVIDRIGKSYVGKYEIREPDVVEKTTYGVINDSLYLSAKQAGLSDKTIMEMAGLFGWDIDFVYDIRKGDRFEVVYEEMYVDGEFLETGRILAARFVNRGEELVGLYFPGEEGDYYTPEGKSMKKAFLRTPINARVSSSFNLQRRHPVLNIVRPHEGIDYAAPVGTPIKAAGSGKVIYAGWKGGYGNTVILKHGNNITTLYAHMNGLAKGIKKGTRVKQGEAVGYLGSSGMVTGPHLHYEFRIAGTPRNPKTVKLPDAKPLPANKMAEFNQKTLAWRQMLRDQMLAGNSKTN